MSNIPKSTCTECRRKLGFIPNKPYMTASKGVCKVCGLEKSIAPACDFFDMKFEFQPKGSMCANCEHCFSLDCKDLPFKNMKVIERPSPTVMVVRCTEYKRLTD